MKRKEEEEEIQRENERFQIILVASHDTTDITPSRHDLEIKILTKDAILFLSFWGELLSSRYDI